MTHDEMIAKVKELAQQCKERDWNGYDAFGIEENTVKLSIALIDSGLVDDFKGGIFPAPRGTINFYYDLEESLCIEVDTHKYIIEFIDEDETVKCYSLYEVKEELNR